MEMKYEVMGIGFNEMADYHTDFKEVVYNEDDEVILETKEKFHHQEDDYGFDYTYAIEALVLDANSVIYNLYMVFSPKSICKKFQKDLIESVGSGVSLDDMDANDMIGEGYTITFGSELVENADGIDCDMLNKIASIYKTKDAFRGFTLDRPFNVLGTNGWDWIEHCIKGKKIF